MQPTHCTKCGRIVSFTGNGGWAGSILWCNCPRPTSTETITSTSSMKECEHFNGFWKRINFKKWIFNFDKRYYVCTDCRDVFDNDYIVRFWKNIIKQNAK